MKNIELQYFGADHQESQTSTVEVHNLILVSRSIIVHEPPIKSFVCIVSCKNYVQLAGKSKFCLCLNVHRGLEFSIMISSAYT